MQKINLFDFDKTIYDGDSTIDFYLYCLRRQPKLILALPRQMLAFVRYAFGIIGKNQWKEGFFSFLTRARNVDSLVLRFWESHEKKIKSFYLEMEHSSDVVISASPEFLLAPICAKLGVKALIATKVDQKSGRLLGKNCRGTEKVSRLKEQFPDCRVLCAYSDSLTDLPMLNLAEQAYLIRGEKRIPCDNQTGL